MGLPFTLSSDYILYDVQWDIQLSHNYVKGYILTLMYFLSTLHIDYILEI
jgi:hypothetical protein